MTERMTMIWKTSRSCAASRPATAITTINESQPTIHQTAFASDPDGRLVGDVGEVAPGLGVEVQAEDGGEGQGIGPPA